MHRTTIAAILLLLSAPLNADDFILFYTETAQAISESWAEGPIPVDEATAKLAADRYISMHRGQVGNYTSYSYVETVTVTTNTTAGTITAGWILNTDFSYASGRYRTLHWSIGFAAGCPSVAFAGYQIESGTGNIDRKTFNDTIGKSTILCQLDAVLIHGDESAYADLHETINDSRYRNMVISAMHNPGVPYTLDGPYMTTFQKAKVKVSKTLSSAVKKLRSFVNR